MFHKSSSKFFLWQICIIALLGLIGCISATEKHKQIDDIHLIPQDSIKNLLEKTYTEQEKNLVRLDFKNIHETCFLDKKPSIEKNPVYLATAGSPGACKTTILESYMHDNNLNFVYADPDQRALRYMINTYYQSITNYNISKNSSYETVLKNAYIKWRDASNHIANSILNDAFSQGYDIAHGTTSTSPNISVLYDRLKEKNYKIVLLLCYLPDETKIKALEHRAREQGFVQVVPEDIINKSKMFPERFPVYFAYADELHFYWTQDFATGSIDTATYTKETGLVVKNQKAFDDFIKKYDDDRKGTNLLSFNELLQMTKK